MLCRNCHKELPANSSFCSFCGAKQDIIRSCPKCGARVLNGALFCLKCGTHIDEEKGEETLFSPAAENTGEPFYRKWIAEHRQLAETKRITWISEFRGNYAIAIDDSAPGRELRPFLVRGVNSAETVCYMNWCGANLANGVIPKNGDCFSNGTRFLSFILFRSNSMVAQSEYRNILQAFTGIMQPYATSGVVILLSRNGGVVYAAQYQENITGIADIFPIRVIGEKYCLYTDPDEYNKMTNRERYNAVSEDIKTAAQDIVDCESGTCVIEDVFAPKYDGDPSGNYVEYFYYNDKLAAEVLRSISERDIYRSIFNRGTGRIYPAGNGIRYRAIPVSGAKSLDGWFLLKISDISESADNPGGTGSGRFELIDGSDRTVIALGRYDIGHLPDLVEAGGRLYICAYSPETADESGAVSCANNITNVFCYEKHPDGSYERKGAGKLRTGGGFTDGVVRIHTPDGRSVSCYGAFTVLGKTYISLIKERDEATEEYDKCLLLDDSLKVIYWFNYKQHYGSQAPYGIHIFDDVIYSLSSEENEFGDEQAVLKNVMTSEVIFSVSADRLISNANAEFGKRHLCPRYEFGGYRAEGKPYFLTGRQNQKLGLMDLSGRMVIPEKSDIYFIVSSGVLGMIGDGQHYARLPANTFLAVLGSFDSDMYRLYDAAGQSLFEGAMSDLVKKYE